MFYFIGMIELLLPCGLDTLEYFSVKATIGICILADYSVAMKCQQLSISAAEAEFSATMSR
jgi:hypothetical protein